MRQEILIKFKQQLLEEREQLSGRIDLIDGRGDGLGASMKDSIGELSTIDNHPADIGSEMFERGKDFALRESAMIAVKAIDNALEKIESGTYGVCDECGKDIAEDRLEAIPSTTKCHNCKRVEEKIPDGNERPVEEEALGIPFAGTGAGDSETVEYDGEDAWQDVSHYVDDESAPS